MFTLRGLTSSGCFWGFLLWGLAQAASAVPLVFTLNPSLSQLTASGYEGLGNFSPQAPGSLTTTYSGSINVDLTGTTITFTGGSLIAAQTNGSWQPAVGGVPGNAPADYGGTNSADFGTGEGAYLPGNFALRNLVLDLTSPVLAMTNGSFNGSGLTCLLVTNTATIDYYYSAVSVGTNSKSQFLNGSAPNTLVGGASVSTNAGERQLVLQFNGSFASTLNFPGDTDITFSGQLVATTAPPIIQSIANSPPNVVITTQNTTAQSVLVVSTNLMTWSPASATLATNGLGMIVFTAPLNAGNAFYRVQQ
jgi:hypothetical protein